MKSLARNLFTGLFMLTLTIFQIAAADQRPSKNPLFFYIFVHDDIAPKDRSNLHKNHFEWLQKDLESFTGRRVRLQFIENTAPWTNFRYQGDDLNKTLSDWTKLASQYRSGHNLPVNGLGKYLLLTQNRLNSYTGGVAGFNHHAGIASTTSYPAPAHELGHMLGGTHEAAEVIFKDGWWCETNIVAVRNPLRANCYVFSDMNKQQITARLSEWP